MAEYDAAMNTIPDDAIPLPLAATLAGVTDRHMRTLVEKGTVTGLKIGRNYLVSRASAEAFVRHPTAGRPPKTSKITGKKAARKKSL